MVVQVPVVADSLLQAYSEPPGFADAYVMEIPRRVHLAEFVESFYVTWLFKLERALLSLAGRPSTDVQASKLAQGQATDFSAWTVEGRTERELLLCDVTGRTRSWFMVEPTMAATESTRIYFGSAITAIGRTRGNASIGLIFKALLGFHHVYSVALLNSAAARLARKGAQN